MSSTKSKPSLLITIVMLNNFYYYVLPSYYSKINTQHSEIIHNSNIYNTSDDRRLSILYAGYILVVIIAKLLIGL